MVDCNATNAALRAGYAEKSAHVTGARLLKNANVQEKIAELGKEISRQTGITAERVVAELAKKAFSDVRKLFDKDGELIPISELDDDTANTVASFKVKRLGNSPVEIVEVKQYDSLKALELIGKHLGMFVEKVEDVTKDKQEHVVIYLPDNGRDPDMLKK